MIALTAAVRAELFKLTRRRALIAAGLVAIGLGVISSLGVFLAAEETAGSIGTGAGENPSLSALAEAGGATRPLGIGISFVGGITVALVGASVAGEFSHGTMRTLLLHQPHRSALLVGKVIGLLLVTWTALALALVVTVISSIGFAAVQDVPTEGWWGIAGLAAALGDYAGIAASLAGWALFGTVLATLLRSVPLTLGVGVAWIGPLEHITSDAWNGAFEWYPGLLLENVLVRGTNDIGLERSLSLAAVYAVAATLLALLFLRHRDVTA
jgi:ABC-2 type transport system permease protein